MIDWNSDPELRALHADFVASLSERQTRLASALAGLRNAATDIPASAIARHDLQFVAHKLAGVAGSYGFPMLTEIGGAIDELLDADPGHDLTELMAFGTLLDDALSQTAAGRDTGQLNDDKRLLALRKAVARISAESTNESS